MEETRTPRGDAFFNVKVSLEPTYDGNGSIQQLFELLAISRDSNSPLSCELRMFLLKQNE